MIPPHTLRRNAIQGFLPERSAILRSHASFVRKRAGVWDKSAELILLQYIATVDRSLLIIHDS
jgi:hypothetical protein